MDPYFRRHTRSILLLPGIVTIIIPGILVKWIPFHWPGWDQPILWNRIDAAAASLLLAGGTFLFIQTISLFIATGEGTLAPWDPTRKLVAHGPYRHVRNPMISGVLSILLGEALLARSITLLLFFGFALLLNLIYIPLLEEPGLRKRFGADYITYCRHVPRWIPRFRPWKGL